jgi:hypothetical protein
LHKARRNDYYPSAIDSDERLTPIVSSLFSNNDAGPNSEQRKDTNDLPL